MNEICNFCQGRVAWEWEEAFDKFGFCDGDGQVETWQVARVIEQAGYGVIVMPWGIHNVVITSITQSGEEIMPDEGSEYRIGYDNPRTYLPAELVRILDERFYS